MKQALLVLAGVALVAWAYNRKLVRHDPAPADQQQPVERGLANGPGGTSLGPPAAQPLPAGPQFQCDGRERCPQMRSCDEALYFLRNCPNVKMDGDGDGIPCEDQWCRHLR